MKTVGYKWLTWVKRNFRKSILEVFAKVERTPINIYLVGAAGVMAHMSPLLTESVLIATPQCSCGNAVAVTKSVRVPSVLQRAT